MRGKKAKQLRVDRTAEREAARRKQRQQTIFTVIVIAIIVGIGGVLVGLTINEERQAAELAASEAASDLPTELPTAASEGPDTRPVACGAKKPKAAGSEKTTYPKADQVLEDGTDYGAVITTSCGAITVDLDEERSPETVNSFVFLAEKKFFDGLEIFRNATSIGALQTGSGTNEASWDVGYKLKDELRAAKDDGYPAGTLAMANAGPNTGGSQFFFVYNDKFTLEPAYAVFGEADAKGKKVLEEIGGIPVVAPDAEPNNPNAEKPSEITYIESVKITTN